MKRALKWIAIIVAVLVVLALALPFLIDVNTFRPRIESELTNALGRKVTVGNLSLSLLSGSLAADDITIADDPAFSRGPFVKADALNVGVNVLPLVVSKKLEVRNITLRKPQVSLIRTPGGKWNFSTIGPTNASATPANKTASEQDLEQNFSVGELSIRDGQITVADTNAPARLRTYSNVDVTVKNFSFTSQFPFTLSANLAGGGKAKLEGTAGPINRTDASLTPLQAKISVDKLDLARSGLFDPSAGFAGSVNFAGDVASDGREARSNGEGNADGLQLSPKGKPAAKSVALKYATAYSLQKESGQLTRGDVTVGKAIAKLSGSFDTHGTAAVVNMKLNADNMPVEDLETLLPALGIELPRGSSLQGGTLSSDLTINGPVNQLVITGPVKLANTTLAGFDLGSKMSAIASLAGIKTGQDTTIQNFSSDVRYSPSGVQTQNINLVVPAIGTITGAGTMSPQNALDYKMAAKMSGGAIAGISQMSGGSIPFFIQGTASDPKFVPDVKGMVSGQLGGLTRKLGSSVPGGQNTQGVVDALGGLFGKKKKQ